MIEFEPGELAIQIEFGRIKVKFNIFCLCIDNRQRLRRGRRNVSRNRIVFGLS